MTMNAQDQGITSSAHQNNIGKIVFSKNKSAISFKNEDQSQFKNSFSASEPLHARIYTQKSIGNTPHEGEKCYNSTLIYKLFINGNEVSPKKSFGMYRHIPEQERSFYTEEVNEFDRIETWTTWRPYFLPELNDDELKFGAVNTCARAFVLSLLEVGVGTHDIKMEVYSRDVSGSFSPKLAEGSFQIKVKKSDIENMAFRYAPPLPKDEWIGENKNGTIEQLKNAFINQINQTPLVVGISGRDWREGSYSLTGQKYRKISGWAVFPKDSEGDGQVPITTFNFISDYTNGGWTKLRFDSYCNGCPDWDVELAAVKAFSGN